MPHLPDPIGSASATSQRDTSGGTGREVAAEARCLRCVRCGAEYALTELLFGCPVCAATVPANLEVVYEETSIEGELLRRLWEARAPGVWRYAEMLPIACERGQRDWRDWVTLGEGGTPLIACERIGASVGLPRLAIKHESTNPTWSFKDRLASVAISWAKASGAPGVAASSSGNAGAAVAAYAARAGMPCIIFTTRSFPGAMQRFMRSYGAMVVATPTGPDRWTLNRAVARDWGWVPISNVTNPPVGSHPVGIEGYKTIAYEIAQERGWQAPDAMIVPVGYGDAVAGIWRGFQDLHALGLINRLPRMIAAETFGSLQRALAEEAPGPVATDGGGSVAFSVATPQGTFQALRALRASGGAAVTVSDAEAWQAHQDLAHTEGVLVELSSALPLAAARKLAASGDLRADDNVVLLVTSSGVKDLEIDAAVTDELPLVEPDLAMLRATLRERFGYVAD